MLGLGSTRVDFTGNRFYGVEMKELNELQDLLRITILTYFNEPTNVSPSCKRSIVQGTFDKGDREGMGLPLKMCKLYEFST